MRKLKWQKNASWSIKEKDLEPCPKYASPDNRCRPLLYEGLMLGGEEEVLHRDDGPLPVVTSDNRGHVILPGKLPHWVSSGLEGLHAVIE